MARKPKNLVEKKPRRSKIMQLQLLNEDLQKNLDEMEKIIARNGKYSQQLELELAQVREKNLNLIEAINIISRAERLRIQSNLWGRPLTASEVVNAYEKI